MNAARRLLARRDFTDLSVRQIAAAAHLNPAMVHYHFGTKHGLYAALAEEAIGPFLERMEAAAGEEDETALRRLFEGYVRLLAANPWLPNLVVREVFYGSGPFRDAFIERFAARVAALMPGLFERAQRAGRLDGALDPRLGVLSLLSMAVFPFVARPIAEGALGLSMDEAFTEQWVAHCGRVIFRGGDE
jgi:AcrR family transcriptional regulator